LRSVVIKQFLGQGEFWAFSCFKESLLWRSQAFWKYLHIISWSIGQDNDSFLLMYFFFLILLDVRYVSWISHVLILSAIPWISLVIACVIFA
jgi:hypothetical protein